MIGSSKESLTPSERLEMAKKRRIQQLRSYEQYEKHAHKIHKFQVKKSKPKKVEFPSGVKLISAASRKDAQEVERILQSGSDPDEGNDDGVTALHQSAIDNSVEIVTLLLKYKADSNVRDREMWTPLHAASACGNKEICRILLENGADLLAMNGDGNMPYDICEHQETLDFIEGEMLKRGISQEDVDSRRGMREKLMLEDIRNELAKTGNIPTYKGVEGESLLHISSSNGFIDVTEMLLNHEANIKAVDDDLWQPIHCAIHWGQFQVAEILIRKGADLYARTRTGLTALDLCASDIIKHELLQVQEESSRHLPKRIVSLRNSKSSAISIKKTDVKGLIGAKDKMAEGQELLSNIDKFYSNEESTAEPPFSQKSLKKDKVKTNKERRRSSTTFFNALIRGNKRGSGVTDEGSESKTSILSGSKEKPSPKKSPEKPCLVM